MFRGRFPPFGVGRQLSPLHRAHSAGRNKAGTKSLQLEVGPGVSDNKECQNLHSQYQLEQYWIAFRIIKVPS